MERYTSKDVHAAFKRLHHTARDAGVGTDGWTLHPGSTSNGIAWGLTSTADPVPYLRSFGHIGKTAREAAQALEAMSAAFELVARGKLHLRQKGE